MIEVKELFCTYQTPFNQFSIGTKEVNEENRFNLVPILERLSLKIEPGHVYGVIGRNGAGKTTLLNCISGVIRPMRLKYQRVFVDGNPLNGENPHHLAKLFYVTDTIPNIHVKVCNYAGLLSSLYPHFKMEHYSEYMKMFQIDTDKHIDELSLGQKKMVFLSYAFASGAPYIILDEPTNGLDITSRKTFRKLIASNMSDDRAIIISTHHINEVSSLLDHIVILNNKQIAFDHSVMEISSALSFIESDKENGDALYSMSSAYGKRMILPNTNGADSEIDYELLFEAVLNNPDAINSQFSTVL
ncbi:MAG: ABC transporter ATP-binding protein [Bacteroidaceae bacterium]|nr:ABC transporter ATP-binding protein [Bacteroidaceae bacterium]